ncbi:type I restriction-modification system subunit M/S [Saccharothrix australiensis]|uniref:Type I restriction enzyme M protein n=1 Tax=Saccharothrix australiensis TaxID=2072 RepID=A0A495VVV8_9PSEU|nr:type I restriction-modification system subunit M/S [Saccharothrix australiensis]RKT53581.1 type I restriction enzyme M protein [Saccharothrix australiensis]
MVGQQAADGQLVSRAEVARLAGVRRPAVTNWERRHADFPRAVRSGENEYFRLAEVVAWLAGRPVPSGALAQGEALGTTYGDRVRRKLGAAPVGTGSAPSVLVEEASQEDVVKLIGPLAARVRGAAPMADYLSLIFALLLLRSNAATPPPAGVDTADAVRRWLRFVGDAADKELRQRGLQPGMLLSVMQLQPRRDDLAEVVRLSSRLGPAGFRRLLDLYEADRRIPPRASFTPPGVTRLMAELVLLDADGPVDVYDPYVRGGELLAAVVEASSGRGGEVRPVLFGRGRNEESLRLAGVNLAVHGTSAQLTTSAGAPWCDHRGRERKAHLILTNPPFNDDETGAECEVGWTYGDPPAGNANFAWLQHILDSLDEGGRAVVLMPNNAAVSERERVIRKEMVGRSVIECVIALPPQLFTGTPIAAALWLLRTPAAEPREVLFLDAGQRGVKKAGRRTLTEQDVTDLVRAVRAWRSDSVVEEGVAGSAGPDRIELNGYSVHPSDYVSTGSARARAGISDVHGKLSRLYHLARDADSRLGELNLDRLVTGLSNRNPKPWKRVPLTSLCQIQAGPSYSRLGAQTRTAQGTVPLVLPKHIRDRRIVAAGDELVGEEIAVRLPRFRLAAGDIVCVRTGSTGASALVTEDQAGWLCTTNLLRLHDLDSEIDSHYLLAYLSSPEVVEWIRNRSKAASAVTSINVATLGQLPVVVPPEEEQRRIGIALTVLDEQIAAYRELADTTRRLHTTLSDHLLSTPN